MDKFRGRPAFVTGGASGIGLAIGRELARREMKVALADNDADTLKMACSGLPGSVAIALDTTDASRWGPALDEAEAELGPLAVLVVNAGVAGTVCVLRPARRSRHPPQGLQPAAGSGISNHTGDMAEWLKAAVC
ncbi:SDR family NAD(P)-dependent oxidoreductase [uncultured Sphingorhabdus sp.]|uniref:SDR family NAD(P)-dependent oxidoreductase n=1 Tax=uncultured Sphingorhabdus sp. TaxID=1686106 RepID=UPI00261122ED|nr:SDR family NAD(P)-dependent oxidoreductase [uncultured Sphingorhabdus sp.]